MLRRGWRLSEGLARFERDQKWGYVDKTGAVMVGGKWGYIDTTGKMVIQPMPLMRAEDFHHGLAFVSTKEGRYGYIDKSGKYLWTPTLLYKN